MHGCCLGREGNCLTAPSPLRDAAHEPRSQPVAPTTPSADTARSYLVCPFGCHATADTMAQMTDHLETCQLNPNPKPDTESQLATDSSSNTSILAAIIAVNVETAEVRGMCPRCQQPVTSEQEREKTADGQYWHLTDRSATNPLWHLAPSCACSD